MCGSLSCLFLLLAACAVVPGSADIPSHVIQSLPGWDGTLPNKQYSGYIKLDSTSGKRLHYWFVESTNDPKTDPVLLWLNGGPGCSSMDGYFNEQGPLHFDRTTADNRTVPSLIKNPYTWTNMANIIYLESPAGVGFSYSDNPEVDYIIDDNQTALDNYHFLINFFTNYSEYEFNDFYIAGESYAGIYIPTLVNTIRMMNDRPGIMKINLKGFMVGNGCVGNKMGGCGTQTGMKIHIDFYHGHALFPNEMYDVILKECGDFMKLSDSCIDLINEMSKSIGAVNIYDIYKPCLNNFPSNAVPISRAKNPIKEAVLSKGMNYHGPDECIDDHVEAKYFDSPAVRTAIHVESKDKIGGWRVCTLKLRYHANTDSLIPLYPTLIQKYRTMIINGDVDGCVPFNGNEAWTSGLGFKVKEGWRPWIADDQVAGYVTEYDANGFKFVTVKGSGHMVPWFRPKQAYTLFERFIKNMPL